MEFFVEKEDENIRIDLYLATETDLSRSAVQKLIENEDVQVNGLRIKANYRLRCGDIVCMNIPEPKELKIEPENMPLDIIFEDRDIIVINKDRGVVVHPAAGHFTGTLVNGLLYHCGNSLSGINGVLRPGIVHRIDKDTSGILVVAKNDIAHRILSLQLAEHSMLRKYIALVYNNLKCDKGTIDKPIARHKTERKKMAVAENGKRAVTHYSVLQRFGKYTLIEAQLETGRTHQIRVHMSYLGHTLVGDSVYGAKKAPAHFSGQALHAESLGFVHPTSGKYMEFKSELPQYFKNLLACI